jgi:hypothetical protein
MFTKTTDEVVTSAQEGRDTANLCSAAQGLEIHGTESTGQTTFQAEACARVDVASNFSTFNSADSFVSASEFFTRPVLLKTGTLPTTRTQIDKYNVSVANLWALWGAGGTGRVANAALCRFRPVFTLQIGTTPFAQGLLCLSFNPAFAYGYDRQAKSALCTNIPHVLLDVASQTTVVLRMPFLWFNDAIRVDNTANFGTVSINAVLPVSAGSGTVPQYKLYMHLEDLTLSGVRPAAYSATVLQAGGEEVAAEGPISGPVRKAGGVVKALGEFSSLRPFTRPLAWFTDSVSKTAFSMGFSKPTVQTPPSAMVQMAHVNHFNVDVPSILPTLGPFNANSVKADPTLASTEVDEMDLKFLTSQYGQLAVGSISTTDAHGALLWWTNITPACYYFQATSVSKKANKPITTAGLLTATAGVLPTHLAYWSGFFRYWRGGTRFRFTFAKTKMHGGRVMVEFVPYGSPDAAKGATSTGNPMQPTGYTKLFDLRDGNTFEFDVPFISDVPWCTTLPTNVGITSIGTISIRVMDPLVSSTVTSTSVPFLVEVCGDKDFEFASLQNAFWTSRGVMTVVEQSGGSDGYNSSIAEVTVGERFTSVKQLMMIPVWNNYTFDATHTRISLRPWWYQNDGAAEADDKFQSSMSAMIAGCYAFARGKSAYWVQFSDLPDLDFTLRRNTAISLASRITFPPVVSMKGQGGCVFPHYPSGPRFSPYAWRKQLLNTTQTEGMANFDNSAYTSNTDNTSIPEPYVWCTLTMTLPSTITQATGAIFSAAADDAVLGMYLGPLPCTYSGAQVLPLVLAADELDVLEEQSGDDDNMLLPPIAEVPPSIVKPEFRPLPFNAPRVISLSQPVVTGTGYKIQMYRVAYGPLPAQPTTTALLVQTITPDSQIFFRSFLSPSTGEWYAVAYVKVFFCDNYVPATSPLPMVSNIMEGDYTLKKALTDPVTAATLEPYFPATADFLLLDFTVPDVP